MRWRRVWPAWLATLLVGASGILPVATFPVTADRAAEALLALDYAFRFASAIANDPKDRAKAQELALAEYSSLGAYDEVVRRAEEVEGWRRGVIYADLAAALARRGRAAEARALIDKAEAVRATVSGWQNPRISSHVADALALLGEREKAGAIATRLSADDPAQYAGRAAATEAVALSTQGDIEEAMKRLETLQGNDDLDVAWWRTSGYLALARREKVVRRARLAALDAARASTQRLPLERKIEALLDIAEQNVALGRHGDGHDAVVAAVTAVEETAPGPSERITLLIELGIGWEKVGEPARARETLGKAESLVREALSIDQPGLLARIASGYRHVADERRAGRLDLRSLEAAEGLALSRPRALALSAICRQLGREGVVPAGALRARLDDLFAGLGEPW